MGKTIEVKAGDVFSSWTVLGRGENSNAGKQRSICRCKCGAEHLVVTSHVVSKRSRECRSCAAKNNNCVERLANTKGNLRHGMSNSKFYNVWSCMKTRCDTANKNYGGRGIGYQESWVNFNAFKDDMFASYSPDLTLERLDVNGDYTKDNCVWANRTIQANNTRRNRYIEHNGSTLTLAEWVEKLGIDYDRTKRRLQKGYSVEDAFDSRKMNSHGAWIED